MLLWLASQVSLSLMHERTLLLEYVCFFQFSPKDFSPKFADVSHDTFHFFSSDENSLKRASELLKDVARQGEETGFGVPCLFIAAKDDLDSYSNGIKDSAKVLVT